MKKLLVVDGSNLLFQMFFGMPSRIVNKDGKAIQGTLGFVGALLKIIRKTEPDYVTVLFDGQHENNRTALNSEYKANRTDYSAVPEDANPFSQLGDIYNALDYIGIKYAETANCEADDWIAGYALTYGREMKVVISSFDSDFFQLITDHVSVLRYRGKNTVVCTPAYIMEKFGIIPAQYADFKSLTGDYADHIKGAEKVGIKTAAMLLKEFGNLENILNHTEKISKPAIKQSVIRNTERLKTNYSIIKLNGYDTLPFNVKELKCNLNGITTTEVLTGIGLK